MSIHDKDLKNKIPGELEDIVAELGGKKYLAAYIFKFIHSSGMTAIEQISPLPKALRAKLAAAGYYISQLELAGKFADPDGTGKYLFDAGGGSRVEAVLLVDGGRRTVCVSTQAGCAMNCAFCATARVKFRENLSAAAIAGQVNTIRTDAGRISNVVYMGMGEPLLNYDQVLQSVRILNHRLGNNIGSRHLTISTCGIPGGIRKLADDDVKPRLAVSLNAPDDRLRSEIMPINRKYPLAVLLEAVRYYQQKTRQRVTFEYVLIKGLNDSVTHARNLCELTSRIKCNVNLIEYNPHPHCAFAGSDKRTIKRFAAVLEKAAIETIVRFRRGRVIMAACGQLGAGQSL